MRLRCLTSDSINFSAGFEYRSKNQIVNGKNTAVIEGNHTWYYMETRPIRAVTKAGKPVATFDIIK